MIGSPRFAMLCGAVATLCVASAAGIAVLPASASVPPLPRAAFDSALAIATPDLGQVDAQVSTMVSQNIFSASRSAPATRWSPPGLETAPPPDMPAIEPTASPSVTADSTMVSDEVPALYGTVVGEGAPRALLRLAPSDVAPRLYAVGERHGGWRVVSIDQRRVVLAGSAGTRTLRLPERPEQR
ncbi:MAG: hypothetical protein MUE41_14025 [Gemmatimonadaceae bacterium]|nr:hypothetical protein [Gemmatimonadaceae bacterium]